MLSFLLRNLFNYVPTAIYSRISFYLDDYGSNLMIMIHEGPIEMHFNEPTVLL